MTTTIRRSGAALLTLLALSVAVFGCSDPGARAQSAKSNAAGAPLPRFAVAVPEGKISKKAAGRLMVVVAPDRGQRDLRVLLGDVEAARAGAAFGVDALFGPDGGATMVEPSAKGVRSFPLDAGAKLTPGTYRVQAVFAYNPDLRGTNAPGNLYSEPETVTLPLEKPLAITLSETVPEEKLPAETDSLKWVKIRSEKLSAFYKRPIFLRAGVVLPPNYRQVHPYAPYKMCVRIGGFNTRYTAALRGRPHPGIVQVFLDGDGPFGDPYSVDSAVSGPYGAATVNELLPAIEKRFDCGGATSRRFTTGGSTGGWVSLALQVYYPDTFGGCWSGYPDSLDFTTYQNINLYTDANAYIAPDGSERVSARDARTGATKWTVREECALENVRGVGSSYTLSGGQWGAWNAVYGAPDKSGRPVPFWEPVTGKIDHAAADRAGKRYDLRRYCAANWKTLAPKLDGKLHLWVGERDEYFLNLGVHKFDDFLKTATPKIRARVEYSPTAGHGWEPRSRTAVLDEMIASSRR